MSIHSGIFCDLCRKKNFSGRRYKCLICDDFDLCSSCYEKQNTLSFRRHSTNHPMQLVITSNDYENVYYGQQRTKSSPQALTCPLCDKNGFSLNFLFEHINEKHLLLKYSVLCPICFKRETNLSQHLKQHLNDNLILKTKTDNQEKSIQQSLLETFFNRTNSMKYNYSQRNLFIQSLLTDLLNQKF